MRDDEPAKPWLLGNGDEPFRRKQASIALAKYLGKLGEQYINLQTGDVIPARRNSGPTFRGRSGVERSPDILDYTLGFPPILGDVKVGFYKEKLQATDFVSAVKRQVVRPGIIFLLESPTNGRIGATRAIGRMLASNGFSLVYFKGPWWEAMLRQ